MKFGGVVVIFDIELFLLVFLVSIKNLHECNSQTILYMKMITVVEIATYNL